MIYTPLVPCLSCITYMCLNCICYSNNFTISLTRFYEIEYTSNDFLPTGPVPFMAKHFSLTYQREKLHSHNCEWFKIATFKIRCQDKLLKTGFR